MIRSNMINSSDEQLKEALDIIINIAVLVVVWMGPAMADRFHRHRREQDAGKATQLSTPDRTR
jgi:hypothetical protein